LQLVKGVLGQYAAHVTATVSLIWLIVLIAGIGVLGGVLLSQLTRKRRRKEPSEPPDSLS